ncbi:lysophospholipase [Melampsora americana]|nr:lysophospholipase [Melampsora americana]
MTFLFIILFLQFFIHSSFSLDSTRTHLLQKRRTALSDSPSGNYAPVWVPCPRELQVRSPERIGPLADKESEYIHQRTSKSIPHWRRYLKGANLTDFNIDHFLNRAEKEGAKAGWNLPNIGIALSGGGPRAALLGASIVHTFDARNPEAMQAGTGGIMQLMNYVAGLSGGSWFTGSWATGDFPIIPELIQSWDLTQDNQPFDWQTIKKYPPAVKIARQKADAGFPASLIDNAPNYGESVLFSSIRNVSTFKNFDAPYPIIVATSRGNKGTSSITLETPIYEFTPEEFGVWHPSLNAFIPIDYLGTSMFNGKVPPHGDCVNGFDNAAFVMGASSNILSEPFAPNEQMPLIKRLIAGLYYYFTDHMYDEALVLNPFNGLGIGFGPSSGFPDGKDSLLYLADGGLGGENMPLWPLIQPARKLDVIFAVDAQADGLGKTIDAQGYANGTSLYMTYLKTQLPDYQGYPFPKIPDTSREFSARGLHQRPSLFGCNETSGPLVIYFPNYYIVAETDVSTVHASYTPAEIEGFLANGFAIATQARGISTVDDFLSGELASALDRIGESEEPRWITCIACGLIDRQNRRDGISRTPQCEACFTKYCA